MNRVAIALVVLFALAVGVAGARAIEYDGDAKPGVTVLGADVGGKSRRQIEAAIRAWSARPVTIHAGGRSFHVPRGWLVSIDARATASRALAAGSPLSLVVPYDPNGGWTGGNYFGASLGALVKLGRSKGYHIVGCCFAGVNAFFVREDLCGDHFVEPSTAEEHYEPERYFTRYMPSGHRGKPGYFESV